MNNKELMSEKIIGRIKAAGATYDSHDNIHQFISPEEFAELQDEVKANIETLLRSLIINIDDDIHTKDTVARMTKMYLQEVMSGRYLPSPEITAFDNVANYHELLTLGPISARSMCSHHFVAVIGEVYVGVVPHERVWGISKFARIINWYLARPHVQENATEGLADLIDKMLRPKGVVVFMRASHFCMKWRGVKEDNFLMSTIAMRGVLREEKWEQEFYQFLNLTLPKAAT